MRHLPVARFKDKVGCSATGIMMGRISSATSSESSGKAMVREELRTFAVKEFTRVTSAEEAAVEEIKLAGYTVLTDVLLPSTVVEVRRKLDHIYRQQIEELGGEHQLAIMNDAHTARCPLAYDEQFLDVAAHPRVLSVVERLLGDYFTLMVQNGILNVPQIGDQQNAGSWHRDLNYQHFICSRPLSVSALFCIDDFTEETGGTFMLPGSHKTEMFPSEDYVRAHEIGIRAKAGSVLVFDSMLYHRGGNNRSQGARRAINHMYTLPFIKQQIDLPKVLDPKYRDDPFMARFLGYESEPDVSVAAFRRRRLARVGSR
jgi:ectoine hydroxylase-related dioxygenase (phytanoyl-CoA dioxygenase family)